MDVDNDGDLPQTDETDETVRGDRYNFPNLIHAFTLPMLTCSYHRQDSTPVTSSASRSVASASEVDSFAATQLLAQRYRTEPLRRPEPSTEDL